VPRAVLLIPDGQLPHYFDQCHRHCQRLGYDLAGMVRDPGPAADMLCDRTAGILVIARRLHLPAGFEPRIEVAGDADLGGGVVGSPRRRRPQPL